MEVPTARTPAFIALRLLIAVLSLWPMMGCGRSSGKSLNLIVSWYEEEANHAEYEGRTTEAMALREKARQAQAESDKDRQWKREHGKAR